jgi:hypothetical protein
MDEDIEGMMRARKVFFIDTNLSNPVLTVEIESTWNLLQLHLECERSGEKLHTLGHFKRTELSFFRRLAKVKGWKRPDIVRFSPLLPEVYPEVEREMLRPTGLNCSFYDDALMSCSELEEALKSGLKARGLPPEEIEGTSACLGLPHCNAYRSAYEEFCNLFGRAESRTKDSEHTWTRGTVGHVTYWVHANHSLIFYNHHMYYSSLNQVLMLKDKLATRYMLLEHVTALGIQQSCVKHLTSIFQWQDTCLTMYGNEAYNILKAVEPMFKTRLSHVVDNVFGKDTAYTRMFLKLKKKEMSLACLLRDRPRNMIEVLVSIVERVETVRELVELFGCQKSCGHPTINAERGGLSAAHEARTPDTTSLLDAQKLRNTFCQTVLESYVRAGSWPKLVFLKKGTVLQRLSERQERNLTKTSYPLEDWNNVEWTKILDFDYYPNFLELIDDKSISFYRSDKHLSWDTGTPTSQRRLLLEILRQSKVDIKDIVERVSRRDIPWDWFIVSLYPKEREFKLDPRMFAMMVWEMRCFFTAVEANLAHGLFRFLPQQTMTNTKTQNQERFLKFTDPGRKSSTYTLFMEIDLTRWNLRWRELVIHMLGHDINQMYGVKGTFTVTHWFFSQCQIVVRVPGLRPEGIEKEFPPETSLAWRGHKGGFEGINQKLWSAATYAMIDMATADLKADLTILEVELVGQGDNQVVRFEVPAGGKTREELLPGVRDTINDRIDQACRSVNQETKPEENVESTSVLTYSKDVYVSGVEYPTSLKKHSRLFPVTSMDFPSVTNNTRAILAGAVAGAENAIYPLRSSIIGWYHAYRYLLASSHGYCIHGKSQPRLSHKEITAALAIPSSLGGLAGVALASFLYKGGSDPLGKEVSGLRFLSEGQGLVSQLCSSALRGIEERYCIEQMPNLETLIDNPYGLPLAKPSSPLSRVGELTLTAFRSKVKNSDIKPLLSTHISRAENVLKRDLLTIRPVNPILLHDMFDASGFGTIKLMRKMFLHTRTIQSVAQWVNPDITHIFLRADKNDILWFKQWVEGMPQRGYSGRDSFSLVTLGRSYWGVELHGVTTYQPLDFIHRPNQTRDPSSIKWSAHSRTDLLTARGPLTGYVGTATREKRSEHGYKIVDSGSPSRALMKLQLIRSQAYGNQAFNDLLDKIALTRCPTLLSSITDLLPKVVGGSISHRYVSVLRTMLAAYVGPLNFVTHIRLDTNSIGKVSGSALNYPIMIQEQMVMAQAGAKMMYHHRGHHSGELLIHIPSLDPLPEDSLQCVPCKFSSALLPRSTLLYSQQIVLRRTYDQLAQSVPRSSVVGPQEYVFRPRLDEALVGFFVVSLKDQNRAKTLADTRGTVSIPAKYQLDIAEAHSMGPTSILNAIASAIVTTSIRDTFRTIHLHPERWDESLFLAHSIIACIRAASSYWTHPLFMSHPEYYRYRASSMRYSEGGLIQGRLVARVRREISSITSNYNHRYWDTVGAVFSGESAAHLFDILTVAGAKLLTRLYIIGDPKVGLYSSLYASYMKIPSSSNLDHESLLSLIRMRLVKLSQAISKEGDLLLSKKMFKLSHFDGISIYNDDIQTVLRSARQLTVEPREYTTLTTRPHIRDFPIVPTYCPKCKIDPLTKYSALWERYRQRYRGGIVTAGYTWLPLVSTMRVMPTSLVVGSGNGGLANLLISCFRTEVTGLDLEADMPGESATLLYYLPVGIELQNREYYTQSDWSINSSGDWSEASVREMVITSLPGVCTLFYDATGPSALQAAGDVIESMIYPQIKNAYLRLIGSKEEVWNARSLISDVYNTRSWISSSTHHSVELLVEVDRYNMSDHTCRATKALTLSYVTPSMQAVIPDQRRDLIEAAVCYTFSWENESLDQVCQVMRRLCLSLLDKPGSKQLLYKDRKDLIVGYSTMVAVTSDFPLGLLNDWIADDIIETDLFTFGLSEHVSTHLIKYVSRLSLLTDESPLAR